MEGPIFNDLYSRFIEMTKLSSTASQQVIIYLKTIFAHYEIQEALRSDNGPQYSAYKFKTFANKHEFEHIISSLYYPQSNGEAEKAVKTLKSILKNCHYLNEDIYLGLLSPLSNGYSSAKLLIGQNLEQQFLNYL